MNSTDPAEFDAYLEQFPNGMFRALAQVRLAAAEGRQQTEAEAARRREELESERRRVAELRRPGRVFRDCDSCPEMVVLAGGTVALGRFEVTVAEYRAFAEAAGRGAGTGCPRGDGRSWRDPGFPQTDRHPVTCVTWQDAQAFVLWLSRTTGERYRLPTEAEWDRAAVGSQPGCHIGSTGNSGTYPVGPMLPTTPVCSTWSGMSGSLRRTVFGAIAKHGPHVAAPGLRGCVVAPALGASIPSAFAPTRAW